MTDFLVNVYPGYPSGKEEEYKSDDMTDQGQSDSVREVLTRFAREGVTPPEPNRAAYADSFSDDEDLRGERVRNLFDTPDLSNMDEMDMVDFINENSEVKSVKDFQPKQEEPAKDPPASDPNISQNSPPAE